MADTGWVIAGAGASTGTGDVSWSLPERITASDTLEADAQTGTGEISELLYSSSHGLNVPQDASIDGLMLRVERREAASLESIEQEVRLTKDGTATGTDKSDGSALPTARETKDYGSSTDLWGQTWSAADVNASGFGALFRTAEDGVARVDAIWVKVFYTEIDSDNERLAPNNVETASSNLEDTLSNSPPTRLADIDEDTASDDGEWWTAVDATAATEARVGFGTPSNTLISAQNFKLRLRKTTGTSDPTVDVELWEAGSLVSTLLSGRAITTTDPGEVVTGSWSAGDVTNAADVECRVVASPGQTGGSTTDDIAPNDLIVQTNLSGALADIDDDPDSPDGNWLTASDNRNDSDCRVGFATPAGNPSTGAGLQTFKFWVRAANSGGSNIPWVMDLFEAGSDLGQIASGTLSGSSAGTLVSGTWDASSLSSADGSSVEARIFFTGQGGNPGSRNTGEVGAVEWVVARETPLENETTVEIGAIEWNATIEAATGTDHTASPSTGSLVVTGQAPSVSADAAVTPNVGVIEVTGFAPDLAVTITLEPLTGAIEVAGLAPAVSAGAVAEPQADAIGATGLSPEISANGQVELATGQIEATGHAPDVVAGATIEPEAGAVEIAGQAPLAQADVAASPDVGSIAVTGHAPSVDLVVNVTVEPGTGSIELAGLQTAVSTGAACTPGAGSLTVTGVAPHFAAGATAEPTTGAIEATGLVPTISAGVQTELATGQIVTTGFAPTVAADFTAEPSPGTIEATGFAPRASAIQRMVPTAVLATTNLQDTLSNVPPTRLADIDESVDDDDAEWWTAVDTAQDTSARVGLQAPSGSLVGTQQIRVLIRGTSLPSRDVKIELWEAGVKLTSEVTESVSSDTGQIVTLSFPASEVANANDVEVLVLSMAA